MTLQEIIKKAENIVQNVVNGASSQYFNFEHPNTEEIWTIRISDHNANPSRVDSNTISFVVLVPENNSEEAYESMSINKKNFKSLANQFFLNENGDFTENFYDMEECLEYILDV